MYLFTNTAFSIHYEYTYIVSLHVSTSITNVIFRKIMGNCYDTVAGGQYLEAQSVGMHANVMDTFENTLDETV